VSHRTGRALEAAGADGAGVLRLSRYGSAPAHADKGSRARRRAAPTDRPSSNPFAALGSSIKAGAKAGGVLLWVLLAVTLALFAAAWVEYRRRAHSDAG
jgi:hypothetical protein